MSEAIYRYKQNDYNDLTLLRTDSGSLQVVVSKDRGNRVESIFVPPEEVARMMTALMLETAAP